MLRPNAVSEPLSARVAEDRVRLTNLTVINLASLRNELRGGHYVMTRYAPNAGTLLVARQAVGYVAGVLNAGVVGEFIARSAASAD